MDPPVNQAEALHTVTLHIYIYREGRWTPQSIEHRGLAYHHTAYIYKRERREMDPPLVNQAQRRPYILLHCIYI